VHNATQLAFGYRTIPVVKRIERIRLYPTQRQMERLSFALDVTRELYNAALQQRRDAYRRNRTCVTGKQQYAELTELRAEDARVAAVYRENEDAVLRRLDLAFAAFFSRIRRGDTPGYPRFKARQRWSQLEYPHGDRALKFDDDQRRVRVPGSGWVKLRKGRRVPKTYGRAWIVRRCDRWYACFECERDVTLLEPTGKILGVDRGIAVLAALDDGTRHPNHAPGARCAAKVAAMQRKLEAVTQRDGRGRVVNRHDPRRIVVAKRLARARAAEANARRDQAHKVARTIVTAADVIGLEALGIRRMTRSAKGTVQVPGRNVRAKAGLNRRMLDAGFGLLRQMIVAKAEEAARRVVEVDARYSSQTCSHCGHVAAENRRRRRFCCVRCGHRAHADVEAAREIRRRVELRLLREPNAGGEPVRAHDAA
jgi:putative transposase